MARSKIIATPPATIPPVAPADSPPLEAASAVAVLSVIELEDTEAVESSVDVGASEVRSRSLVDEAVDASVDEAVDASVVVEPSSSSTSMYWLVR